MIGSAFHPLEFDKMNSKHSWEVCGYWLNSWEETLEAVKHCPLKKGTKRFISLYLGF